MKLTVLGSGTMMPTKKRHPAGYLVEAGNTKILMDCGHTTVGRLVDMDVDFREISILTISHFHTDHFGDFMPLIHALWVNDMLMSAPHRPLTVFAPVGFKERWQKLREIFWSEPNEKYPFDIIEGPVKKGLIETFPVNHIPYYVSQGTKITYQGKTLAYTGDIGSDEPIIRIAKNVRDVDLLVIEAGVVKPRANHFTAEQAINLQKKANIKNVILSHIRDKNLPLIKKAIKNKKNISIANDKQIIKL